MLVIYEQNTWDVIPNNLEKNSSTIYFMKKMNTIKWNANNFFSYNLRYSKEGV